MCVHTHTHTQHTQRTNQQTAEVFNGQVEENYAQELYGFKAVIKSEILSMFKDNRTRQNPTICSLKDMSKT